MSPNKPRLLNDKEAGEFIGIKPSTLSVWRCTGKYDLPFVKSGSRVYYLENDLLQFIESRRRA